MKRIIAFDGLDCTGKSTVISSLSEKLLSLDYIPYIIHLTGPNDDIQNIVNTNYISGKVMEYTPFFIQWEKFIQTFKDIKIIIDAHPRNIVILDRTPYSENIWCKFFNRHYDKVYKLNDIVLNNFMQMFSQLNEAICIVNLDVCNTKILHRLFTKDADYTNYLNAFDLIYKPVNPCINITDTDSKVLYMINQLKEEFNKLFVFLRSYNIETFIYENNVKEDINIIIDDLIRKITETN